MKKEVKNQITYWNLQLLNEWNPIKRRIIKGKIKALENEDSRN